VRHNYNIKYTDDRFGTHIIICIYNGLHNRCYYCVIVTRFNICLQFDICIIWNTMRTARQFEQYSRWLITVHGRQINLWGHCYARYYIRLGNSSTGLWVLMAMVVEGGSTLLLSVAGATTARPFDPPSPHILNCI